MEENDSLKDTQNIEVLYQNEDIGMQKENNAINFIQDDLVSVVSLFEDNHFVISNASNLNIPSVV